MRYQRFPSKIAAEMFKAEEFEGGRSAYVLDCSFGNTTEYEVRSW